jgi:hypothetical protein
MSGSTGSLGGFNFTALGSGISSAAGAVSSFAGAAGDLITAAGEQQAAGLFGQAATLAGQSATEEEAVGKLQQVQTARQVMLTQSNATAAAAANGLRISGSSADIIRSNAQQGALANQLIGENTQINVNSYLEQQIADQEEQEQAETAASAAKKAASGGFLGGILQGLGAVTSFAGAASSIL